MDHNKFTTGLDKRTNKFCETENWIISEPTFI
jgi:hypothetical protein